MVTITRAQLAAAERIIKGRVKIACLRKQALQELHEQVSMLRFLDKEDVSYISWVFGGEPAVQVLTNWIQVNGHSVRQLNKDISESLGLNNL